MIDFLSQLFDTSDFPARWNCGQWSAAHGWLHIASDLAIFGAYAAIPLSIAFFVRQRKDVVFPKLFLLFAAFIFSCGLSHLVEATLFWSPWYRLSGAVKLVTAFVSWATVVAVFHYLPQALASPAVVKLNQQLKAEADRRKAREEEIRELNLALKNRVEELEALFNMLPVGIGIATDPGCRNIRTNEAFARILRVSTEANASLSAPAGEAPSHFKVMHGQRELSPTELPIQASALRGVIITDFEEELVFDSGQRIHLLAFAAPLYGEENQIRGAVGAFIDISERRQREQERLLLEKKLQDTQRLESLGVLAGGVAHDFNNLLTAILGSATLARMEVPVTSPLTGFLDHIEQVSMRAADLCKQLLAYAGLGHLRMEQVDLSQIIAETTTLLQSSISKNASLKFNLNPHLPRVLVDMTQIRQVIMNLVINASEALSGKAGTITLATGLQWGFGDDLSGVIIAPASAEGPYVSFEVTDTGCGMAAETLSKIFDPFFTTKFTGRGLGLAAVLGIVRRHRGGLKVETQVGRGTTFRVLLPASEKDSGSEIAKIIAATTPWKGKGTVLVIEDEEAVRTVTASMLRHFGFDVLLASDGRQGSEIYRERAREIDLVLLDLTMPQLDGRATLQELRAVRADVKVILMSGFIEQGVDGLLPGKGLSGFLPKPFGADTLQEKLRAIFP